MSSVFVSYSRADIEIAKDLKKYLQDNHFTVWMDITNIETGTRWKEKILDAIRRCSAFVLIATPRSEHSHWVMRELSYAIEFQKDILVLKEEGDLWPVLAEFQCADTRKDLLAGLGQLTELLIWNLDTPEDAAFSQKLADELKKVGANLWTGSVAKLKKNLTRTKVIMLLVISPEAMKSQDIRALRKLFEAEKKDIIPILFHHSNVSLNVRQREPYINFLDQDFDTAFSQLYGRLRELGVSLNEHTIVPIPRQPPLLLDPIEMFKTANEAVWISGLILDKFAPRQ